MTTAMPGTNQGAHHRCDEPGYGGSGSGFPAGAPLPRRHQLPIVAVGILLAAGQWSGVAHKACTQQSLPWRMPR